jgi:hypothetical protein
VIPISSCRGGYSKIFKQSCLHKKVLHIDTYPEGVNYILIVQYYAFIKIMNHSINTELEWSQDRYLRRKKLQDCIYKVNKMLSIY